ncbi:NUDIX hydrolase [Candidatus Woesebacteria bacterium]|nr:NUDIX hydrolase [Candidatus Woesebacteria bacterium]
MTEYIDIIDEKCQVIDIVTKEVAHAKGLLHETVVAEIFNARGEMLLVKQSDIKQDAGRYVSPVGGHVTSGETLDMALKREAQEEVGLVDFTYTKRGAFIFKRQILGGIENHHFNIFEIQADFVPVLNEESVSFKWFPRKEMDRLFIESPQVFGKAFLLIWEKYYLHDESGESK